MKRALMLLAAAGALASGPARADTQAVSREATLYVLPKPPTLAVSREATLYILTRPPTVAVSREATFYIATVSTQAASREATMFVNYRPADVIRALRLAAGFDAATGADTQLLNVITGGVSATVVDVLDAAALGLYVGHPERLP